MHKKVVAVAFLFFVSLVAILTVVRAGYYCTTLLIIPMFTESDNHGTVRSHPDRHKFSIPQDLAPHATKKISQRKNGVKSFFNYIANRIKYIENQFDDKLVFRTSFVDLHGFVLRLLDKKVVDSFDPLKTVVKDTHHRIHFGDGLKTSESAMTSESMEVSAEAIANFSSFAAGQNTPILCIQVPNKANPLSDDMPIGVPDYSGIRKNDMLKRLREKGISVMDLNDEALSDQLDWYSLHYRTDHHWTIETAFWAHAKTIEKLNAEYHLDLDPDETHRNIQSYDKFFHPLSFLGSTGKQIGRYYAGVDDFSYYLPRFDTQIDISIIRKDGLYDETSGTFFDAIVDTHSIQDPTPLGRRISRNRYAVYFGDDHPLVQVFNAQGNRRVLMIQDSHGLPFSAFLALSVQEIDIIDLRYFTGSVREFISQKKYDMILMLGGGIFSNRESTARLYK